VATSWPIQNPDPALAFREGKKVLDCALSGASRRAASIATLRCVCWRAEGFSG